MLDRYPMKLVPVYKDYLWGGKALKAFGKTNGIKNVAESWELSCNDSGLTKVAGGVYEGVTLAELANKHFFEMTGTGPGALTEWPILIKLIDATLNLSIQVHPSDATAIKEIGEMAKSEFWCILDASEDAFIYLGFNKPCNPEDFQQAIKKNEVLPLLRKVPVRPGDAYYIPAGTIHALGAGTTIAEIQQNSDTTFRIYDYDRIDSDGLPRALHIDRAMAVLDFTDVGLDRYRVDLNGYFDADGHFRVRRFSIDDTFRRVVTPDSYEALLFLEGYGNILWQGARYPYAKGDTYLLPAGIGDYVIEGKSELLIIKR